MDTLSNITHLSTNPVDWLLMLKLLLLLAAGIAIYSLYKARIYIANNTFIPRKFINEGWMKWLWAFCLGALIEVLVVLVPEIDDMFTQLLGINITNSVAGAVFLGIGLIGLVHNQTKTPTANVAE